MLSELTKSHAVAGSSGEASKIGGLEGLVSASEAVCASILPRRILFIHTASASEVD